MPMRRAVTSYSCVTVPDECFGFVCRVASRQQCLLVFADVLSERTFNGILRGNYCRYRKAGHRPRLRTEPEIDRTTTRAACTDAGLSAWDDPHNSDPSFARVRVRREVLPVLSDALGRGIVPALARTARLLREDADALDALAPSLPPSPVVAELEALVPALRARALKSWAEGVAGGAITSAHVDALRALVEDWHGQGAVALPGGVQVRRTDGRLTAT